MYYTLGDITFAGQVGPSSVGIDYGAPTYAEQSRINNKGLLQRTGEGLDKYSLEVFLSFGFADVEASIDQLKGHLSASTVLDYAAGNGRFFGTFVITKLSVSVGNLNPSGEIVEATVSLELLEFVDPDPDATRRRSAVTAGVAVAENGVIPVRVQALPATPTGRVVASLTSADAAATRGAELIARATNFAPERESLLDQAGSVYREGQKQLAQGIDTAGELTTLASRAPALLADMEAARSAFNLAVGAVSTGDLTNARTAGAALSDATAKAEASGRGLSIDLITRRA